MCPSPSFSLTLDNDALLVSESDWTADTDGVLLSAPISASFSRIFVFLSAKAFVSALYSTSTSPSSSFPNLCKRSCSARIAVSFSPAKSLFCSSIPSCSGCSGSLTMSRDCSSVLVWSAMVDMISFSRPVVPYNQPSLVPFSSSFLDSKAFFCSEVIFSFNSVTAFSRSFSFCFIAF